MIGPLLLHNHLHKQWAQRHRHTSNFHDFTITRPITLMAFSTQRKRGLPPTMTIPGREGGSPTFSPQIILVSSTPPKRVTAWILPCVCVCVFFPTHSRRTRSAVAASLRVSARVTLGKRRQDNCCCRFGYGPTFGVEGIGFHLTSTNRRLYTCKINK